MNEEKRNEQLISEKGSTELWTVVEAENEPDSVSVRFGVPHPDKETYSVKKKAYSSAEVEGFKKQLSSYYYEVYEEEFEVNDDWGIRESVSRRTYAKDIDIGDAIVRGGKLLGLFINGCEADSSFHGEGSAVLFINDAFACQSDSYFRKNMGGYDSSIWSDSYEYRITLKLRDNG